jgi:O-antigen/teichoic acid export membrane protein
MMQRSGTRPSVRSAFSGTRGLAVNGGALIVNVFVSGIGGFAFWIIAARSVEPASVAQATAMITSILGVVSVSQQSLVVNLPILIAGSPRPRRLAGRTYIGALSLTALSALIYLVFGTRFASGLDYLRDVRLSVVFALGCIIWSIFALQDAVLTGVRKGKLVLLENTVWSGCRLILVLTLPLIGLELGVGWVVSMWLVPATILVGIVTYYLFITPTSPLRHPLGTIELHRRALFSFLAVEHLVAVTNGVAQIVVPAVALTALGATSAAPFLAAFQFLIVIEVAMGTFAGAFAVEVRRQGHASRKLIALTCGLLGGLSLAAIVGAQFFGKDFMALFGPAYREPGGEVLAILVLGLPASSIRLVAGAGNRLYRAGWRNFAQQGSYCAALFLGFAVIDIESGRSLAICLVFARLVAAVVSIQNLNNFRSVRARAAAARADAAAV